MVLSARMVLSAPVLWSVGNGLSYPLTRALLRSGYFGPSDFLLRAAAILVFLSLEVLKSS